MLNNQYHNRTKHIGSPLYLILLTSPFFLLEVIGLLTAQKWGERFTTV